MQNDLIRRNLGNLIKCITHFFSAAVRPLLKLTTVTNKNRGGNREIKDFSSTWQTAKCYKRITTLTLRSKILCLRGGYPIRCLLGWTECLMVSKWMVQTVNSTGFQRREALRRLHWSGMGAWSDIRYLQRKEECLPPRGKPGTQNSEEQDEGTVLKLFFLEWIQWAPGIFVGVYSGVS